MSLQAIGGSLGVAVAPVAIGGLASLLGWRLPLQLFALAGLPLFYLVLSNIKNNTHQPETDTSVRTSLYVLVIIAVFYLLRGFVFKGITTFLPTYFVEERGLSLAGGGLVTGIFFFSGAFAQLLGGKLADNHNEIKILVGSSLASALLLYLVTELPGVSYLAYLLLALLGLTLYISVPATLSLVHRVNPKHGYGKAFGLNATMSAIAGFVSPIVVGHIGDTSSLSYAFHLLPGLLVAAGLAILLLRNRTG